jgi:hypothetical protein
VQNGQASSQQSEPFPVLFDSGFNGIAQDERGVMVLDVIRFAVRHPDSEWLERSFVHPLLELPCREHGEILHFAA